MYWRSGSNLSNPSIVFSYLQCLAIWIETPQPLKQTHIVNTIPPLRISLANRGTAPDQKVITPSCLKIFATQTKLFLYSFRASIDCILLTFSTLHFKRSLGRRLTVS